MATIQMGHAVGEVAPNTFADIIWVREQWNTLLEKYGEVSILVFNKEVVGVGDSYASAIANAEANLVEVDATITPIHERLRDRKAKFLKTMAIKEFMRERSLKKMLETLRS